MPYAIYLRKSRADLDLEARGEMETLARHEKSLLTLASKMGLNVTKIYKEIVSGETISARPEVQKLLTEVEQGAWEGVLVMEVERLARGDTIDQGIVARAFGEHNTKIITPVKTYDPSNEFDEEYFEFGLFMSRREYKTINRRIQRGRVASVKEGRFIGSVAPFGYDKVKAPDGKGFTLAPNDEAQTVIDIYTLYCDGVTTFGICDRLNDLGIRARTGGLWSPSSVRDILKNPVYIGKIRWGYKKEKKIHEDGTMRKERTRNAEYILVDGMHQALVTEEAFNKAQELLARNRTNTATKVYPLQNPLSGLVYCRRCGALMTRQGERTKTPYAFLRCPNRFCDNVAAPLFLVEQEILNQLEKLSLKIDSEKSIPKAKPKDTVTPLERQLKKLEKQIETTYTLLEQGIYTVDVFTSRQKALNDSKVELLASIETEKKKISEASSVKVVDRDAILEVLKIYGSIDNAKDKNTLLKAVVSKVVYNKDKQNTRGKFLNANFQLDVFPNLYK